MKTHISSLDHCFFYRFSIDFRKTSFGSLRLEKTLGETSDRDSDRDQQSILVLAFVAIRKVRSPSPDQAAIVGHLSSCAKQISVCREQCCWRWNSKCGHLT